MSFMRENRVSEMLPVLTFRQDKKEDATHKIQCFKCDKICNFPEQKDDFLAHLFLEHRLVIADVDEIAILEEYLNFWQKEFKEHEFETYCTTMLLDQLPDGTPSKNERYYLLSDVLPKDFELRKNLQQQRLEKALTQHQFERTDRNFCKECLYCREVIKGLRADFLEHLFTKHFLQLGKPENLVYVDDLIAKVQQNLEQLVCLYCEKIFKDRVTLKEHMRKKGHKRINPSNRIYDKYFLINYRYEKPKETTIKPILSHAPKIKEPQRSQPKQPLPSKESDLATSPPQGSSDFEQRFANNSSDDDSDWSSWNGEHSLPLICLFCSNEDPTIAALEKHMLDAHSVDFDAVVKNLNFYSRIKVINYVRRQICLKRCVTCNLRCETQETLMDHMSNEGHFGLATAAEWDKPEYFFPTYEDDGLLCILDDNPNDSMDDTLVKIISEDTMAQINKDAERLSLENFKF